MPRKTENALFRSVAPAPQTLLDRTTEAAKQIISDETHQRDANIARLRALRLAKEKKQTSSDEPAQQKKAARKKKTA